MKYHLKADCSFDAKTFPEAICYLQQYLQDILLYTEGKVSATERRKVSGNFSLDEFHPIIERKND